MKRNVYSINHLIKIEVENGVRVFIYQEDVVCKNYARAASDILKNRHYPLVTTLEGLPQFDSEYVVLKGYDSSDYKKLNEQCDDEVLGTFYSFYSKQLDKLSRRHENKITIAKNIYQMLELQGYYMRKKYPQTQYKLS